VRELYFAYGSNMSRRRLAERIGAPEALGPASLGGHRLRFNKPSKDGSGKANLVPHPDHTAWGVLWWIHPDSWPILDGFEPGYTRSACRVRDTSGDWHTAQVYLWSSPGPEQKPFAGYLAHILEGAQEHHLPPDFIRQLAAVPSRPDPD
jgi:hypothetical protein